MGLVGAAASATAAPITYNINFTTTRGIAPTSGVFTYNDANALNSRFSGFNVIWNSRSFDLTASANAPSGVGCGSLDGGTSFNLLSLIPQCPTPQTISWLGVLSTFSSTFAFSDQSNSGTSFIQIAANSGGLIAPPLPNSFGTFTITPAGVPEPSTISMALTGYGGAAILAWKRRRRSLASTLPQTTKQ